MSDSKNFSEAPTPMWQAVSDAVPVPNTSMLPPAEPPASAADDMLKRAVQGAHTTIDRLADKVAPATRQVGEGLANAECALSAKSDQILQMRDEWTHSLRATVRNNPLTSVATALAIGVLIARITR